MFCFDSLPVSSWGYAKTKFIRYPRFRFLVENISTCVLVLINLAIVFICKIGSK